MLAFMNVLYVGCCLDPAEDFIALLAVKFLKICLSTDQLYKEVHGSLVSGVGPPTKVLRPLPVRRLLHDHKTDTMAGSFESDDEEAPVLEPKRQKKAAD